MRKYNSDLPKIKALASKMFKMLVVVLFIFLFVMFFVTRSRVDSYTRQIDDDLNVFFQDEMEFSTNIDETIPIELSIPLEDFLGAEQIIPSEIPVSATVPVETTVHINQIVNVPVDLPVFGRTNLDIPINEKIPIKENIPINTTIQLDLSALETSEEFFSIDKDIAVNIPIDVKISIEDLGLESRFEGIKSLLNTLRFAFLLGEV